jgi:hypothetical protein
MAHFSERLVSANKLIIAAAVIYAGSLTFAHAADGNLAHTYRDLVEMCDAGSSKAWLRGGSSRPSPPHQSRDHASLANTASAFLLASAQPTRLNQSATDLGIPLSILTKNSQL